MADITITHKIEAPELAAAINNLADALKNRPVTAPAVPVAPAEQTPPPVEKPVEAPTNAPVTGAVNGGASVPTNAPAPAPVEETAPVTGATSDPVPAAPTAPAEKVYTFDDITNAGAQLLEAGKMQELMKLLKEGYGVQAVTQLKPEQYAAVADDLRKLGARI